LAKSPSPAAEQIAQADALLEKHDLPAAIAAYSAAIKTDPGAAVAFLGLGKAQLESCDFDAAVETFTTALKLDPTLYDAYGYRAFANAYVDDDRENDVLDDAQKAIDNKAQLILAHAARAAMFAARSDDDNALEESRIILEIDPKSPVGLIVRANAKLA